MTETSTDHVGSSFARSLSSAFAAWSGEERAAIVAKMSPSLRALIDHDSDTSDESALSSLAFDHAAEVRFDPLRVHPTWWIRALADESEAVKRVVAIGSPKPISKAIRLAFNLDETSIHPDHPPHSLAERWALSLWSERLVGGPPPRDDDPLVVRAITLSDRHSIKTLLESAARVKRSEGMDAIGELDSRFLEQKREDIAAYPGHVYQDFSTLGLVTLGRLLEDVEPVRARWTVQHLPYPVAKAVRSRRQAEVHRVSRAELIAWEQKILSLAMEHGTARS